MFLIWDIKSNRNRIIVLGNGGSHFLTQCRRQRPNIMGKKKFLINNNTDKDEKDNPDSLFFANTK